MTTNQKKSFQQLATFFGIAGIIGASAFTGVSISVAVLGAYPLTMFLSLYCLAVIDCFIGVGIVNSTKALLLENFTKTFEKRFPKAHEIYQSCSEQNKLLNQKIQDFAHASALYNKIKIYNQIKTLQNNYNNSLQLVESLNPKNLSAYLKYSQICGTFQKSQFVNEYLEELYNSNNSKTKKVTKQEQKNKISSNQLELQQKEEAVNHSNTPNLQHDFNDIELSK